WDYRYCWPRDAYFVMDALHRIGATHATERYVDYLLGVLAAAGGGRLNPVYAISGGSVPEERAIDTLPGYRGMGPVRAGNQAERAAAWRRRAEHMHGVILERAWSPRRASFVATMDGGDALDASLLLLPALGFLAADDPRFAGTVGAVERELRRGEFVFRYVEA